MNQLDRAFIKVDRKQRQAAARNKYAAPEPVRPAPVPSPLIGDLLSSVSIAVSSLANQPRVEPPAPHILSSLTRAALQAESTADSTPKAAMPDVVAPAPTIAPVETPTAVGEPIAVLRFDVASLQPSGPHISSFTTAATAPLSKAKETALPAAEAPPQLVEPLKPHAPAITPQPAPVVVAPPPPASIPAPLNEQPVLSSVQAKEEVFSRLRPLFEVDRLPWPQICQSLGRAAEGELSLAADEVLARSRRGEKMILVTSQRRGEGRTTMTLCLARQLAARNLRVALVDADFAKGQLVRQLKLLPQAGWEQVLRGEIALDEALVESMEDRLVVLPLQGPVTDWQLLTGTAHLTRSLEQMRDEYDIVLVDAAPLEDDSQGLARLIGATRFQSAIVVQDVRAETSAANEELFSQLRAIPRVEVAKNFVAAA
ncbi:MAG: AAA family ATPase [Pirellulales bacterium]